MEDFQKETGMEPPEHIGLLYAAAIFFIFIAIGLPIVSRNDRSYTKLMVFGVIAIATILTILLTYTAVKIQNKNPKYIEAKEKYQKAYMKYEEEMKLKAEKSAQNGQATIGDNNSSKYGELRELSKLKDEGIITVEEFDVKKKQILGL
jgi:4-amino-4-deoxy-L-arabinose transferase-like glycosyltransferase